VVRADEVRLHQVGEAVPLPGLVRPADPAVRDERVDRPVRRRGRRERGVDLLPVADVGDVRERAAELHGRGVQRVDAAREQAERRAVARAALRDRLADPASSTVTTTCLRCSTGPERGYAPRVIGSFASASGR
jgi:hypothetical protein